MKVKINLNKLLSNTPSSTQEFTISNVSSVENIVNNYQSMVAIKVTRTTSTATCVIYAGGGTATITGNDILNISLTNDYIIVDGEFTFTTGTTLLTLLQNEYISFDINGKTAIFTFKQYSDNHELEKTITYVDKLEGVFNHSIGVKNINIDVNNFQNNFNYVWIPSLKRYYYVDSIEIISANITRLHLKEDVLMSWKDLIKIQSAFVSRYENSNNVNLVDSRLPLEDVKTIEMLSFTNGALKNCTFNYNIASTTPAICVTSMSTKVQTGHGTNVSPSGSNLPTIRSSLNDNEFVRFITYEKLEYLVIAYRSDDATSSFIENVIYFPFDCTTLFNLSTSSSYAIQVKDKYIDALGNYVNYNASDTPLQCYGMNYQRDGVSPYIVIADISITNNDAKFDDYEPYSNYEIYIPFVSWVKIEYKQFVNQRILVYYSVDLKTGMSTAYVYNYTNKYIIWSGACQLGIKLDLTTTNQLENQRQRESSVLNTTLGLMSSTIAVGVGIATVNPVAIAGGVIGGGKTIASAVNTNRMLFERAQSSFGTPECSLFAPNEVKIRRTYNQRISLDDDATFSELNGKPYNNYVGVLGDLSGYVEIPEIHFKPKDNVIYQDEINEIVSLLKDGVIL